MGVVFRGAATSSSDLELSGRKLQRLCVQNKTKTLHHCCGQEYYLRLDYDMNIKRLLRVQQHFSRYFAKLILLILLAPGITHTTLPGI